MKPFLTKYIIIISLLFLTSVTKNLFAQNLVKNPSFEDYYSCPNTGVVNGYLKNWDILSLNNARYFNSCHPFDNYSVPSNDYGYQTARTGNAYAAIIVYYLDNNIDMRGYMEVEFLNSLKKDSLYCISYFTSLGDTGGSALSAGPNGAIQT